MKETELKENPIEIAVEDERRKQIKLIGRIVKRPGLTIWEIDLKAHTIKPATFKKEEVVAVTSLKPNQASSVTHKKIEVKPYCLYIQALNKKSAFRKFQKNAYGNV